MPQQPTIYRTLLLIGLVVAWLSAAAEVPPSHTSILSGDSIAQAPSDTVSRSYMMPNITVVTPRTRYTKRGNPALDLVQYAMEAEMARRDSIDYSYRLRGDDRLTLSLANFDLQAKWLNTLFPFLPKYVTHSRIDGKWVLPLSIRDRVSDYGYSAEDEERREVIRYSRHTGIDQSIDDGTITVALEEFFPDVDLYRYDTKLLDTHFASPLSHEGLGRYKYYLSDTVILQGYVARTVTFFPFVPSDPTFRGTLYFTASDPPRLLRSDLIVPDASNLNFLDALSLTQIYDPTLPDHRQVSEETLSLYLRAYRRFVSLYVEQTRHYSGHTVITPSDSVPPEDRHLYTGREKVTDLSSANGADRYAPTTDKVLASDQGLKDFLTEIKAIPLYRTSINIVDMLAHKYVRTRYDPGLIYGGSKFDFGPIDQFVGANEVEGLRLRLGGRTTGFVSSRVFLEGYGAYGFRDQIFKHSLTAVWSFRSKGYYREEFPRNEVELTKQYDLFTPGQLFSSDPQDNSYYRFGTSYLTNRSYRNIWHLQYLRDYGSTLSLRIYLQHITDRPVEYGFPYVKVGRDGTLERQWSITDSAVGVEVRWAPGEQLKRGSMERYSPFQAMIKREYPVIYFKHETATKVLGGEYLRNRSEIRIEHRLPLSTWDRLDYQATVGKLWNSVPFPLLYIPPVNRGFSLHDNAFKILYPLEYVADEWFTLFAQWHMRGLVFNRIPFVNNLNLRGVWSVNYLYGNTTSHNQQAYASDIFILPTIATEMRKQSYVEVGFGIENILQLGRIDVYRRITPMGPYGQASPWAFRGTIRFDF